MSDAHSTAATRAAGAASLLAGAGTAVGFLEGSQWAELAMRGGVPLFLLLLALWAVSRVLAIAGPYLHDAFTLMRDFVTGVKTNADSNAAALKRQTEVIERIDRRQEAFERIMEQRHSTLCSVLDGLREAKDRESTLLQSLVEQQRETNRLLRTVTDSPRPSTPR